MHAGQADYGEKCSDISKETLKPDVQICQLVQITNLRCPAPMICVDVLRKVNAKIY